MNAPDRARAAAGIEPRPTPAQTVAYARKLGAQAREMPARTAPATRDGRGGR